MADVPLLRAVSHSHHSQNGELLDFTLQFADGSATRFEALTSDFTAAISIFVQCQISARKSRGAQGKIDTGGGPPSDVVVIDPKRHTERPNCFSRPMGFGRLPPPMPSTSAPLLSTQQSVLRNRISKRSQSSRDRLGGRLMARAGYLSFIRGITQTSTPQKATFCAFTGQNIFVAMFATTQSPGTASSPQITSFASGIVRCRMTLHITGKRAPAEADAPLCTPRRVALSHCRARRLDPLPDPARHRAVPATAIPASYGPAARSDRSASDLRQCRSLRTRLR